MKRIEYITQEGTGENDKQFFEDKYGHLGISSRWQWYNYKVHKQKGATNKTNVETDKHVRKGKGNGGSTDFPSHNTPESRRHNKKYIPPKKNIEDIFDFSYEDMWNTIPNTKFNILMDLKFTHEYDSYDKQLEQERFIDKYYDLKDSGDIEKVNEVYQKLSAYIKKNHLGRKDVDGSVICNVAIMTSEYIENGNIIYDYDFLNNIQNYNENENFRFHLWLILQCFTAHNIFYHKYVAGYPEVNWWAICKLQHRWSDKDMKTKGQCSGFKDNNGKYIYRKY